MTSHVAIIGDGQMGLVLADALASRGVPAAVWGPFPEHVEALARTRVNAARLPGLTLDEVVTVTTCPEEVFDGATLAINAIPAQFIRPVWSGLADRVPGGCPLISVAKGIEIDTLLRGTEVLADVVGHCGATGVLSGPTIAHELASHLPAVMIAASDDAALASTVQDHFDVPWLRIYTGTDVIGVEVAGACKNVIALAAGVCDGLQLGDNAKSGVLARGLAEITRLGVAMGAQTETFHGLAGVGDLATTCFSPHGRNRTCGEALGSGESLESFQARSESVVEGVATTKSVNALAARLGVDMPIAQVMHAVLFDDLPARDAVRELMGRRLRAE